MTLVTKILEGVLIAGQTSIVFTDTDIPNSLIRVYTTNAELFPLGQTISGNNLTINYEAQTTNIGVAVEIAKQGLVINDTLTSTATDEALSAAKGKSLKDSLDALSETVASLVIPDEITDLSDVNVTDIQNDQILAWDSVSSKFINKDPSSAGETIYSTTETKIGKWIDNTDVYRAVVTGLNVSVPTVDSWSAVFADSLNIKVLIDSDFFDTTNATNMIQLGVEQTQVLNGGVRIIRTTGTLGSRTITQAILVYTKN